MAAYQIEGYLMRDGLWYHPDDPRLMTIGFNKMNRTIDVFEATEAAADQATAEESEVKSGQTDIVVVGKKRVFETAEDQFKRMREAEPVPLTVRQMRAKWKRDVIEGRVSPPEVSKKWMEKN